MQRLILFTRFPEPGRTKTRLIPLLGAEGAADLQRQMTRRTLDTARRMVLPTRSIEVRHEGGSADEMARCFGGDVHYRSQLEGDLGARMRAACEEALAEGAQQVVIIGADCPELSPTILENAFAALSDADVVVGPASDGGYYLIGLRRMAPELFCDMPWGSRRVLAETRRRAQRLSLGIQLLDTLGDVDRPEDLTLWRRIVHRDSDFRYVPQRVSVVIPTRNEAALLPATIASIRGGEDVEIIIVDADSDDGTAEVAESAGCRVVQTRSGRALQLNAGADVATGEFLVFLHADTRLASGFDSDVRDMLSQPGVAGGAFRFRIDATGWPFRVIEKAVAFRAAYLQMPYGDQCLFVSKRIFQELGGFPPIPIMDDYEFVCRLRRRGRIAIASSTAITSGRRWLRLGPWRTTWINQKIILAYHLGVSTERLASWYKR